MNISVSFQKKDVWIWLRSEYTKPNLWKWTIQPSFLRAEWPWPEATYNSYGLLRPLLQPSSSLGARGPSLLFRMSLLTLYYFSVWSIVSLARTMDRSTETSNYDNCTLSLMWGGSHFVFENKGTWSLWCFVRFYFKPLWILHSIHYLPRLDTV